MIFKKDDIAKFMSTNVVQDDEFTTVTNLHTPTGVFFSCVYKNNDENNFLYFIVAVVNDKSELNQKKSFEGDTSENFYEAVTYFESLITERVPEEKPQPPSSGIFVYAKNSKYESYVNTFDLVITIPKDDVLKAFTPPKKKPYGRLDMTIFDNPEYDPIKMKFALNFDEQLTKKMTDENATAQLGDIYVYQLTPYSNNTEESQGEGEPENVNDDQLTPDQIEGEDPEELKGRETEQPKPKEPKNKEGDKSDEGDKGDKGDKGDEGEQGDEGDESEGEGEGEGDQGEGDSESDEDLSEREGGDEVDTPNPNSNEQPSERAKESDGSEPGIGKLVNSMPEELTSLSTPDIVEGLNELFKTQDLSSWKKQQRLLNALSSFNDAQLKEGIYEKLSIPKDIDKKQFIELVKQRTATYFE